MLFLSFTMMQVWSCLHFFLQSSSCLSDKDEDDIYDFAAKYEGLQKNAKAKLSSQG